MTMGDVIIASWINQMLHAVAAIVIIILSICW